MTVSASDAHRHGERHDTAANWSSVNPTLGDGELGIESDTGKMKIGDGSTQWSSLSYLVDTTYLAKAGGTMTGALLAATGSAAAPGVAFSGDADAGIWRYASDKVGITAPVMSSPSGDVEAWLLPGSTGGDAFLRWRDAANINRIAMQYDDSLDAFRLLSYDPTGIYMGEPWRVDTSITSGTPQTQFQNAAQPSAPSISFIGDGDTGTYRHSADSIAWAAGGTARMRLTTAAFHPNTDGGLTLGTSSLKWGQIYSTVGSISTSDATEKDDIVDTPLGLDFIRALRPVTYRLRGRIRPHHGLLAQQVKEVMDDQGVEDFAGYIDPKVEAQRKGRPERADFDEPVERAEGESDEDHDARVAAAAEDADRSHRLAVEDWEAEMAAPLGLRYEEFVAPLIRTVQQQQEQIEALTARVEALEQQAGGPPQIPSHR